MTRPIPMVRVLLATVVAMSAPVLAPLPASAGQSALSVTASPAIWPSFRADRPDHVVRCAGNTPVAVAIDARPGTKVSVGGSQLRSGRFVVDVPLTVGQAFSITVDEPGRDDHTTYVRCIPLDFPTWTAERFKTPEAQWYVLSVLQSHYVTVIDTEGVPVWWTSTGSAPADAKALADGHILFTTWAEAREVQLDGSTVTALTTQPANNDAHEVLRLSDGSYLLEQYLARPDSSREDWGLGPGTVWDGVIQRMASDGQVLWTWSAQDHIPLAEVPEVWRQAISYGIDAYHLNSVEQSGNTFVLSFRHLNAVYGIDATTGAVLWKLGGVPRAESLSALGDPVFAAGGSFSGQHDARVLPDGSLTLHDNGTLAGRAPRALRYRLDLVNRTATLVEQVTDAAAPYSGCCGSARRLPGGDWVMAWGGTQQVVELGSDGSPVFRLVTAAGTFTYRAAPVLPGVIKRSALRRGMDAQQLWPGAR